MATPESTPAPPDAMAMIAAALTELAKARSDGLTADQLKEIVTAAGSAAATHGAESMRQVLHPSNAQHPGKSAFSYPEGDVARPKPVLRPKADGTTPGVVFFCGSREDADWLTPAQIDLYNRFDRTRTSRDGRWIADVNSVGDLAVWVPCKTIDERMDLPTLDLILTELLDGKASVDPVALAERVADLEAQLAAK